MTVDLTPYLDGSYYLYFNVYNDGNGKRTWMFLDDVQLLVCYGNAAAPSADGGAANAQPSTAPSAATSSPTDESAAAQPRFRHTDAGCGRHPGRGRERDAGPGRPRHDDRGRRFNAFIHYQAVQSIRCPGPGHGRHRVAAVPPHLADCPGADLYLPSADRSRRYRLSAFSRERRPSTVRAGSLCSFSFPVFSFQWLAVCADARRKNNTDPRRTRRIAGVCVATRRKERQLSTKNNQENTKNGKNEEGRADSVKYVTAKAEGRKRQIAENCFFIHKGTLRTPKA